MWVYMWKYKNNMYTCRQKHNTVNTTIKLNYKQTEWLMNGVMDSFHSVSIMGVVILDCKLALVQASPTLQSERPGSEGLSGDVGGQELGNRIWYMKQHTIWKCVLCGVSGCGNLVDPSGIIQAFWFWCRCVKGFYYYYHSWHLFMLAVWCCPFYTNRKSDKSEKKCEKKSQKQDCGEHVMTKFSL